MKSFETPIPTGPAEITNSSLLRLQFGPGGNLLAVRHGTVLINQVIPCSVEDGLMRLAARKLGPVPEIIPLMGLMADHAGREISASSMTWKGQKHGIAHKATVFLHPEQPTWFWRVRLQNLTKETLRLDVLHGQDLGLAHQNAVRNNEAYVSQYIDHHLAETASLGAVILSRQNQAQAENHFPWIAQGCLDGTAAYCTDGFQFFGPDHRLTGVPAAWTTALPSKRKQYEFAYVALQSREIELLPGEERTITFFACYEPHHPKASSAEEMESVLAKVLHPTQIPEVRSELGAPSPVTVFSQAPPIAGRTLTRTEFHEFFPGAWRHVEENDGGLLSFFHGEGRHVVTRAKETLVERPHGHLLYSGSALWPEPNVLGTTVYAAGIFNAQIFLGNTNLARFLSVVRNALNVLRSSGQRLFVKIDGTWKQLGMPSAFDVGPHDARWIYHLGSHVLEARTWCWADRPAATLDLRLRSGEPVEFLITHHLALGADELTMPEQIAADASNGWINCIPATDSLLHQHMPGTAFAIIIDAPDKIARLGGVELLSADDLSPSPFAVIETKAVTECAIILAPYHQEKESLADLARTIRAELTGRGPSSNRPALPLADLKLTHPTDAGVARLGEVLPWFAHNAAIHLVVPHGLEQYGGAAWGVRDVCQGPVEWLLAGRRYAEVRRILVDVFAQQYGDDGSWPQWYMHPPFGFIRQEHAHGDIPFWPLKAVCDYIEASNDFSILEESVAYHARPNSSDRRPDESLLKHVDLIIGNYRGRCLPGTALINYGDGDWDDTLQPADPALRSTMVSSWTVGLVFHAFRLWREVCNRGGHPERADVMTPLLSAIQRDFRHLLIVDGQTCGFAIQEHDKFRLLLHPSDTVTGIRHRLLPMTRAILAELFDPTEAETHAELICRNLLFPDGVRLMSSTVPYHGGVETIFKRAESASNFGREIGLQYVHAHLRYAEAMASLGDADALWRALQVVNPAGLPSLLPNAALRQSNTYFSSSDGDFADRYEAAAHFDQLRNGSVPVKGGWRIYSSGPGLYLHKVSTCLLGWRESFGDIVLDPVLPFCLDGLTVKFPRDAKIIEARYRVRQQTHTPKAISINGRPFTETKPVSHAYRSGGIRIPIAAFNQALDRSENQVEIEL